MAAPTLKFTICRIAAGALAVFAGLLLPLQSIAQQAAPKCPAPPATLTREKTEALLKTSTDRGFLWKIEKDGKTAYLYGTIHVNKLDWMLPGPTVRDAIRASEVFAFELDILDPNIQKKMGDPANFGIKNFSLPAPVKKRIEAFGRKVCAPDGAFAEAHPMIQFVALSLLDARFSGAEAAYGSEVIIGSIVKSGGKSIVGLETPAQQMHMLLDGKPGELTEMIGSGLVSYDSGKGRAATNRLLEDWSTGNLDDLAQYEKWCDCADSKLDRDFYKRLNDDRNPGLATGIDKLIRDGKPVFAAVGSLHMTGPKALPMLLANMGYKVERISFASGSGVAEAKKAASN
ncbi:MAG: TraB/GumN family protein [Betaproteobacteria bacterium]